VDGWVLTPFGAGDPNPTVVNVAFTAGTSDVFLELSAPLTSGLFYMFTAPEGLRDIGNRPFATDGTTVLCFIPLFDPAPLPPRGLLESLIEAFASAAREIAGTAYTALVTQCDGPDTTLHVVSTYGFRPAGTIRIGDEIMQYESASDTTFRVIRSATTSYPPGTLVRAMPGATECYRTAAIESMSPAAAPRRDLAAYLLATELEAIEPYTWMGLADIQDLAVALLSRPQGEWGAVRAICRAIFASLSIRGHGARLSDDGTLVIPTDRLPQYLLYTWHVACLVGREVGITDRVLTDVNTRAIIEGSALTEDGLVIRLRRLAGYPTLPSPFAAGQENLDWEIGAFAITLSIGFLMIRGAALANNVPLVSQARIEGALGTLDTDGGALPTIALGTSASRYTARRPGFLVLITPPIHIGTFVLRPRSAGVPPDMDDLGGVLAPRAAGQTSPDWTCIAPFTLPTPASPAGVRIRGMFV